MAATATASKPSFDTSVRCDSCNAQALVVVTFTNGPLSFCGHHYHRHADRLQQVAITIDDRR